MTAHSFQGHHLCSVCHFFHLSLSDYGLTLPHCLQNQLKQHQAPASSLFSPSTSQVVTILLEWIAQRPHPRFAHPASRPAGKPLLTARMYRHLMVGSCRHKHRWLWRKKGGVATELGVATAWTSELIMETALKCFLNEATYLLSISLQQNTF